MDIKAQIKASEAEFNGLKKARRAVPPVGMFVERREAAEAGMGENLAAREGLLAALKEAEDKQKQEPALGE
ncbi:MAG: hypothetical protein WAX89_00070 [Alphaproteobacteria bacterium]